LLVQTDRALLLLFTFFALILARSLASGLCHFDRYCRLGLNSVFEGATRALLLVRQQAQINTVLLLCLYLLLFRDRKIVFHLRKLLDFIDLSPHVIVNPIAFDLWELFFFLIWLELDLGHRVKSLLLLGMRCCVLSSGLQRIILIIIFLHWI